METPPLAGMTSNIVAGGSSLKVDVFSGRGGET